MTYRFLTLLHAKKGTSTVGVDVGRPTEIPPIEEKKLDLRPWKDGAGVFLEKRCLKLLQSFFILNNIKTPFINGYPEEDWFLGFKKRNHLTIKKTTVSGNRQKKPYTATANGWMQ